MFDTTTVTSTVAKNVQDVLSVLAEKFGSTVEGLWHILVRGEIAFGVYSAFLFVVSIVLTVASVKLAKSYLTITDHYDEEWRMIIGGFGVLIFLIVSFVSGYHAAMGIFAPEYMALQSVIELLN